MFRKLFGDAAKPAPAPTQNPKPAALPDQTVILSVIPLKPDAYDIVTAWTEMPLDALQSLLKREGQPAPWEKVGTEHVQNGYVYQAFEHGKNKTGDTSIFFCQRRTEDEKAIVPSHIYVGQRVPPCLILFHVTCCESSSINGYLLNPEEGTGRSIPSFEGRHKYVSSIDGTPVLTGQLLQGVQLVIPEDANQLDHMYLDVKGIEHGCKKPIGFGTGYHDLNA